MSDITVEFINVKDGKDRCMNIWRNIYNSADEMGMASPEWIDTLLSVYDKENRNGYFVLIYENGTPIGIAYLNKRTEFRNYIVLSKYIALNSSGDPVADMIWVEHNQICSSASHAEVVARSVLASLLERKNWDEVRFPGVVEKTWLSKMIRNPGDPSGKLIVDKRMPNYVVDLNRLRDNRMDLMGMLSSEFRHTVKKVLRQVEAIGPPSITAPNSVEEGLRWMREIRRLSISRMRAIKKISSFENKKFVMFHEDYFRKTFATGRVLLQKINAGDNIIGYHYNILSGKRIYFYQCGYNYMPKISPGIFCHYYNLLWAANNGYDIYDFLAGDHQYKRSFSNTSDPEYMEWLILQRNRKIFKVEDACRNIRDTLRSYITSKATVSN